MTVKLVALYGKPEDEETFLSHCHDVHVPLVRQTPHLERPVVGRVTGSSMGEPSFFLMAEMYFPDQERFDEAMRSPENRAAGKDLMGFARDVVTLMVVSADCSLTNRACHAIAAR